MWLVAGGLLWVGAGLPLVTALLIGAAITPTDRIATTPIVTGSAMRRDDTRPGHAVRHHPARRDVRHA